MKKGIKRLIIIVLILAVVAILGSIAYIRIGQRQGRNNSAEVLDLSTPVVVTKVKSGDITESLLVNGSVQAVKEVSIFSSVPGKVKNILVSEGMRVKKEQILGYVERDEAGLKFADAGIESTIHGIVKEVQTEVGASISPSMPLFHIVDMDSVEVVVHIPEKDISRIKTGLKAEISVLSYPGKIFLGIIHKLSPVLDPASRTREAKILVPNRDHTLKPGMFGSTEIIIRSLTNALLVPYSAFIDRDEKKVIYIVNNGKAKEVIPEIDIVKGEKAAVTSGVVIGDRVIVVGQHNIKGGDMVTIVEEIE